MRSPVDEACRALVTASCIPDLEHLLPADDALPTAVQRWLLRQASESGGVVWPPDKVREALPRTLALIKRCSPLLEPSQRLALQELLSAYGEQLVESPDPSTLLQGLTLRHLQDLVSEHMLPDDSRRGVLLQRLEALLGPKYGNVLQLLAQPMPPVLTNCPAALQLELYTSAIRGHLALVEHILDQHYSQQGGPSPAELSELRNVLWTSPEERRAVASMLGGLVVLTRAHGVWCRSGGWEAFATAQQQWLSSAAGCLTRLRAVVAHVYHACDIGHALAAAFVQTRPSEQAPVVLPPELLGCRAPLGNLHPIVLRQIGVLSPALAARLERTRPAEFLRHLAVLSLSRGLLLRCWLTLTLRLTPAAQELLMILEGSNGPTNLPQQIADWLRLSGDAAAPPRPCGPPAPPPLAGAVGLLLELWQPHLTSPAPDVMEHGLQLLAHLQRTMWLWISPTFTGVVPGLTLLEQRQPLLRGRIEARARPAAVGSERRAIVRGLRRLTTSVVDHVMRQAPALSNLHHLRVLHWLHNSLQRLPREGGGLGGLLASAEGSRLLSTLVTQGHHIAGAGVDEDVWLRAMNACEHALHELERLVDRLDLFRNLPDVCTNFGMRLVAACSLPGGPDDVQTCIVALQYVVAETLMTPEFVSAALPGAPPPPSGANHHLTILNLRTGWESRRRVAEQLQTPHTRQVLLRVAELLHRACSPTVVGQQLRTEDPGMWEAYQRVVPSNARLVHCLHLMRWHAGVLCDLCRLPGGLPRFISHADVAPPAGPRPDDVVPLEVVERQATDADLMAEMRRWAMGATPEA